MTDWSAFACKGVPQAGQNFTPSSTFCPHFPQNTIVIPPLFNNSFDFCATGTAKMVFQCNCSSTVRADTCGIFSCRTFYGRLFIFGSPTPLCCCGFFQTKPFQLSLQFRVKFSTIGLINLPSQACISSFYLFHDILQFILRIEDSHIRIILWHKSGDAFYYSF